MWNEHRSLAWATAGSSWTSSLRDAGRRGGGRRSGVCPGARNTVIGAHVVINPGTDDAHEVETRSLRGDEMSLLANEYRTAVADTTSTGAFLQVALSFNASYMRVANTGTVPIRATFTSTVASTSDAEIRPASR